MTAPADTAARTTRAAAEQMRLALDNAVQTGLAHVRRIDPDAAADLDVLRRQPRQHPTVVVVGETKRGKSSLINALLKTPGLSPVGAEVTTSSYVEFRYGEQSVARAYPTGATAPVSFAPAQLRDWATVLGSLPEGYGPPRRIEVFHPAPILQHISIIDTPGVGGLDSLHAEIALDAVAKATALLFVVDASSPFSRPELDFLVQASKRVNLVLFALTKTDAYPGWRTVLDDDKSLLHTHASRFGSSLFFPVSAQLAELAGQLPDPQAASELRRESQVAALANSLVHMVGAHAELLHESNILRTVRSELVTLDSSIGERMRAADPDEATVAKLKADRSEFATRKRKDARSWTLTLNTENRRARTDATAGLRAHIQHMQENYLSVIDKAPTERIKNLPYEIDRALHAISLRLSAELEQRFRAIGHKVLQEVFTSQELGAVLSRLNARLRMTVGSKPRREGGSDQLLAITSAAGTAMMAGRGASMGVAAAMGSGGLAAGIAIPVVGVGIGLAAGAFLLFRRRTGENRQQARVWLKEVLAEARASLSEEIAHRFTDLELALTQALDEAVERRVEQLDTQISQIDKAMAEDKAQRSKKRAALQADREGIRGRIKQLDEVLAKARHAARPPAPQRPPAAAPNAMPATSSGMQAATAAIAHAGEDRGDG